MLYKIKLSFSLVLLICLLMATHCDKDYPIFVTNNGHKNVLCYFDADLPVFPDTVLPVSGDYFRKIDSGKTSYYLTGGSYPWGQYYRELGTDTLYLYIIDADTFAAYSWPQIVSGYKILERRPIPISHWDNNNFLITYS